MWTVDREVYGWNIENSSPLLLLYLKVQDISDIRKFIGYLSQIISTLDSVEMHLFEKDWEKWTKFPEEFEPSPIRAAELSRDS